MILLAFGICKIAYFWFRVIRRLSLTLTQKLLLLPIPVLISAKFVLIRFMGGGHVFAPKLPCWILLTVGFLFGWELLAFMIMLLAEPIRCGAACFRKWKHWPPASRQREFRINMVLIAVGGLLALWALYGGICSPEIHQIQLHFPDLPPSADGLRMAVLADIHAGPTISANRVREFVRMTNAQKPDVVLIVGDFVDGTLVNAGPKIAPLRELAAPLGVFGVPGNHEYYSGYQMWKRYFQRLGVRMLQNEAVPLGDTGIRLAGVPDLASRSFREDQPRLEDTLKNASKSFTILLAHQPRKARDAARLGAKLQISGHTHGGMLPIMKTVVGLCNLGFVSGVYQVGSMKLVVSNGVGIWNGFPLRFGSPSEIILVTLCADKKK